MHCLFFLYINLLLAPLAEQQIRQYYRSECLKTFRLSWDFKRKAMEHAIKTNLDETVGLPGMNVYIRHLNEKLASGFIHDDKQVQVFFNNLSLKVMPRVRFSDVQISLASNLIKIEAELSKVIINANYTLIRNESDIINELQDQDPSKFSPFLFVQVENVGRVAIRRDGCLLTGYVIATLSGESVNLGYEHFNLLDCEYTIEIYTPNRNTLPVIAKYNLDREDNDTAIKLTDLLIKPLITEEFMPKLQAAMYSFVNTSAILITTPNCSLGDYKEQQELVFQSTKSYLAELVRNLNNLTVTQKKDVINLKQYSLSWNEGEVDKINLKNMQLIGLDTLYSAHIGGPVKMDTITVVEELRFSSLQVRGTLEALPKAPLTVPVFNYKFVAEIIDLAVDLQLVKVHWQIQYNLLEIKGLRRMIFSFSNLTHAMGESLISGHLLNEVPRVVHNHLKTMLPQGLSRPGISAARYYVPPAANRGRNTPMIENNY